MEPVVDPGGVKVKPPFEMGVANFDKTSQKTERMWIYLCTYAIIIWFKIELKDREKRKYIV